VVDIIKRCQAEYLRLTECLMLLHGYQARTGVLTAGNYGAPQVRDATHPPPGPMRFILVLPG
jgi:hypothetical protein